MLRRNWLMTIPVLMAAALMVGCGDDGGAKPAAPVRPSVAPAAPKVEDAHKAKAADAAISKTEKAADTAKAAASDATKTATTEAEKAPAMAKGHGTAAAALTVGTLAADAPKPTNSVCPVGGEPVSPDDPKAPVAIHDGKAYALCCADCVAPFMKDPAKYLAKMESK